jgi:RNA polymerase sigma-70 factor (ECF subfamily)
MGVSRADRAEAARSEPPPEADEAILLAIEQNDPARALSLCARRHAQSIGRLCMSMLGSQTDADDLLQETLLAAHESFASFGGRGSVRAWLCGIARNKCLKHLETRRRRGARLRLVTEAEEPAVAEDVASQRERARQARHLLEQVKPSDRDALLLRYCAGLSFGEVAEACGIAEPAARKRVSRALTRLRTVAEKGNRDE